MKAVIVIYATRDRNERFLNECELSDTSVARVVKESHFDPMLHITFFFTHDRNASTAERSCIDIIRMNEGLQDSIFVTQLSCSNVFWTSLRKYLFQDKNLMLINHNTLFWLTNVKWTPIFQNSNNYDLLGARIMIVQCLVHTKRI